MPGALKAVESSLSFRRAADSDAQDLFGLLSLCYADYPGCFIDPHDDLRDLLAPASSYKDRGGAFWVAEDERGRVCACVAVDFPEAETSELHRLYVRPDRRGQGVGALLIAQVERHARIHGAKRIVLWSDTRFTTAHRLYARHGYLQIGEPRSLTDISRSLEYCFEKTL